MRKVLLCAWQERLNIPSSKKILISACLLGYKVRYDGKVKDYDISKLANYELISCCPEVDGGLQTPRAPSEIQVNSKVINSNNIDVTKEFIKGANLTLNLAKCEDIKVAILKSKSPSCSNKMVYDGTFSNRLIMGVGITTKLLEENGIRVYDESEIDYALAYLSTLS